jgi:EmrB/QacA subfamily drug resistance transporter
MASAIPSSDARVSDFRKWGSLVVLSLALAIIVIDTTLLNVSLKTITEDLRTDLQKLQWVISAYTLILTAFTITGGRLGDFFGRKRMFLAGAALFAVGSFIASVSNSFPMLLLGESIIEGIGAALMMPATSSLLVATFRGRDRAIAFGVWGGIAAASAAVGPILGGYLTSAFSWRWGFRINIVVAAVVFATSFLIRESLDDRPKKGIDWVGVILSSLGLTSLVFGFIESSAYGWWIAKKAFVIGDWTVKAGHLSIVPYALAVGALILWAFILWEMRMEKLGRSPLVTLDLFANRQFATGTLTTSLLSLGQSGIFFSIPVFLQAVRGLDAFQTGLSLLPLSLALLIAAPTSGFISKYFTPKRLIQAGLAIDVLALLVLHQSLTESATAWSIAPGMALYGLGMGLMMAQISNISLSAVPVSEVGEASGVNATMRQLGSTLGSAIVGAVLLSAITTGVSNGVSASADIPAPVKTRILETVAKDPGAIQFGDVSGAAGAQMPPQVAAAMGAIVKGSVTDGGRQALVATLLFTLITFAASFTLPNVLASQKSAGQPASGH